MGRAGKGLFDKLVNLTNQSQASSSHHRIYGFLKFKIDINIKINLFGKQKPRVEAIICNRQNNSTRSREKRVKKDARPYNITSVS